VGWTTSLIPCASSSPLPVSSDSSDQLTYREMAWSQRSSAWRKTGSRRSSPRPIPIHWEPWPEKTKTILGGRPVGAAPVTTRSS
jgi:hypothetical protein